MVDPVAAVGMAVGVIGYIFAQISDKRATFISLSILSLASLIAAVVSTNGSMKYWLAGLVGIVAAYFIKRLAAMQRRRVRQR